jgi:protein kinase C-binding protein 1
MSESLDDKNTLSLSPEEVEETVDDVEMSMDRLHQEVEEEEEVVIEDETYEVDQEDHIEYKIIEDDDDERYEEVEEEEEEDVDDETSVLKNGLDPLATSLISSSNLGSQEKDEEEGGEDDDDEEEEIKMVESGELSENVENGDYIETRVEEEEDGIIIPKISREVKNLQITTNESSDIISNFLFDTPRRSKKVVEIPPDDEEIEEDDEKSEKETSKSPSIERLAVSSTSDSRRESIKSTRGRSRSVSKSRSPMKSKSSKKSEISTDDYASDTEELQNNDDESESEAFSERSISRISIDDRKINSPPKPGWDSFCFKCHNDQAVLSLPCSTCKCSYHRNCVRPNPIPRNVDEFVCPECREMETAEKSPTNKYGHERIELKKLSEMLRLILRKTMEGHTPEEFKNEIVLKKESNYPMIVTNMSFLIMESRIKENYYTTSERFIHDLRQLEHNWNVVDRTKAKLLKPILKMVISEINELESCVYCYEDSFNYTDWFVRVCKRPHLLVWAKLKGVSKM